MYPFIHLAFGLEVPTFFLLISLVLSISLFWVVRRGDLYQLPKKNILDLSLLLMVSSLFGARLMHVLYENFSYYRENPVKIFYLWQGGFVFFGGMILALTASYFYLQIMNVKSKSAYFDAFAPVLAFAYGFGRLGCFFGGCCYGRSCEFSWAVEGRHPTQLYALFWEVGTLMILLGIEKIQFSKRPQFLNRSGDIFILWLLFHSMGRLIMENFRDDFRGDQVWGSSISTIFSLILIFISASLLMFRRHAKSYFF
ncbi:MAG: prolipoprotein diacylglyceryl transferase [Pseudobdellovibrionaceae bacterium]